MNRFYARRHPVHVGAAAPSDLEILETNRIMTGSIGLAVGGAILAYGVMAFAGGHKLGALGLGAAGVATGVLSSRYMRGSTKQA